MFSLKNNDFWGPGGINLSVARKAEAKGLQKKPAWVSEGVPCQPRQPSEPLSQSGTWQEGWRSSSVADCLLHVHKTLSPFPIQWKPGKQNRALTLFMFPASSWLSHEQHRVRNCLFCLHIQFPCVHLFIVSFHLWLFCFSFVIIYICIFSFNYINLARDFFCTFNISNLSLCNYFPFYSFLPLSPPFFECLCDHQSFCMFRQAHWRHLAMAFFLLALVRVYGESLFLIIYTCVMSGCVCCQKGQKMTSDPLILSYRWLWMACCGRWGMNSILWKSIKRHLYRPC